MRNNLQLVAENALAGLRVALVVDGLHDGGKVILADLVRAKVPVELSAGRVAVVGVVGGISVTFGRISAAFPGDPDIVALIENASGQRSDSRCPRVHPIFARAKLSVPEEHWAKVVRKDRAIVVAADASDGEFVAVGGGYLVGLPKSIEALVEHLQGKWPKFLTVGLCCLHSLLDAVAGGVEIASSCD